MRPTASDCISALAWAGMALELVDFFVLELELGVVVSHGGLGPPPAEVVLDPEPPPLCETPALEAYQELRTERSIEPMGACAGPDRARAAFRIA